MAHRGDEAIRLIAQKRELLGEARSPGVPVRPAVRHGHPARRLYERCGSVAVGAMSRYADTGHASRRGTATPVAVFVAVP